MPVTNTLSNFILPAELVLKGIYAPHAGHFAEYYCEKKNTSEVCVKCATLCRATYDHRIVRIKDDPIRGKGVWLKIKKRRLWCPTCKKPFTEPIQGILPHRKTSQRYRFAVMHASENYTDLKRVRRAYRCSSDFVYKARYEQLELQRRKRLYPWPPIIGIDEHHFRRHPTLGVPQYASMIVDHKNKRVMEVVLGKQSADLENALSGIAGRENVRYATIDLCDPFKNFIRTFFPNAEIVADKFHVLRLLSPTLLRKRKEIAGDRATLRAKKLLLMSSHKLGWIIN